MHYFNGILAIIVLGCSFQAASQSERPLVMVMEIRDVIDPRMNRYVDLALDEAESREADYVIIDMDTYGGALNDADDIRTRILDYTIPVYVFINKDAASAGALISIACDSIYMAPGSSIGAATVVTQNGEKAPDKYQSYMRSIMRSTAEARGRNPEIAEAMVDENIEIDTVTEAGQVITFSTSEAIKYGFCEAQVESIDQLLKDRIGVGEYDRFDYQLSSVEKVISFFLNPFISGILILIIVGGLYFELQTPGVGFPLIAAAVAAILYFVPYYLNGMAENWEILVFVAGIVLLAVEIFVLPGFGIAGVLGIICTVGGMILVMINNDAFDFRFVPSSDILMAIGTTIAGLMGGMVVMFLGGVRLTQTEFFKRIALQTVQDSSEGYSSNFKAENFKGKIGTAYTVLRPSGKVMIEDELYDAYTRGNYINKGEEIIVVKDEGSSLQVKQTSEGS